MIQLRTYTYGLGIQFGGLSIPVQLKKRVKGWKIYEIQSLRICMDE